MEYRVRKFVSRNPTKHLPIKALLRTLVDSLFEILHDFMRSCSAVHAMITHFSLETFQLRLCMRLSFFFVNHVRPEWKICCLPIVVGLEQTVMAVTHRIEQRFLYSSLRIALTSKDEECT